MNSLCFYNFVDVHSLYDSYGRKNKEFLVSSLSRLAWRTLPSEAISAWDLWKVLKYMLHWDSVVTCNFLSWYSSVNWRKNIKFESKIVKALFGWFFFSVFHRWLLMAPLVQSLRNLVSPSFNCLLTMVSSLCAFLLTSYDYPGYHQLLRKEIDLWCWLLLLSSWYKVESAER